MKKIWVTVAVAAAVALAFGSSWSGPASAEDAPAGPYVGAERCKMCHMAQFRSWQESPMATAWNRVKDEADVEKCVPCHTTGYGKGGFTSLEATPHLVGVQCESCHGPGQAHMATPMADKEARRASISRNAEDGAPDCRGCHNVHITDNAAAARGQ